MHYIEELIAGGGDKEHIHRRFIRYGRGEFSGAAICIKKDGANLKIAASEDYVNCLGEIIAKDSKETFSVSGSIISREDVSSQIKAAGLDVKKSAKKKGFYATQVAGTLSGGALSSLYSGLESAHMLLELKSQKASLKCKKNLPKPSGGVDEKFCSATMPKDTPVGKTPACASSVLCKRHSPFGAARNDLRRRSPQPSHSSFITLHSHSPWFPVTLEE